MKEKNVHTEHCCKAHGCKYGDPDCPVENGSMRQSFDCEFCTHEKETTSIYRNTIVWDEDEIKNFFSLFPTLEKDEVYLLTLFSRNKSISKEERKKLGLPRAHTLAFQASDNVDKIIQKLYRWETNPKAFNTNNGTIMPNESLVPYVSIYPVSPLKAYPEFNRIMTEYILELANSSNEKNKMNTYNRIKKSDRLMLECMHHAFSRQLFVDVDFDIPSKDWFGFEVFEKELNDRKINFSIVETNGGFHYLIHRNTLNYNYNETLKELRDLAAKENWEKWEIEVSPNGQIPLPGTLQYGKFKVKLLNSFEDAL